MQKTKQIRKKLRKKLKNEDFVTDKSGVKTIELIGETFIADKNTILGGVNEDYILRELEWYRSKSLFVKDIPGKTPKIWNDVSSTDGMINSNYGWCIFSKENFDQFYHCAKSLSKDSNSRRAIMIYTRPKMQLDYNRNGMSDFMCTNTVQFIIRDNKLHAIVNQRSMDVVFGYNNDYAWQKTVLDYFVNYLKDRTKFSQLECGDIIWQTGSLHVYERHFASLL